MNSTDTTPGLPAPDLPANEREPHDRKARPDTEAGADGEAAEAIDAPQQGETMGDTASATGDGPPRPRRRRRRRRRPAQIAATGGAGEIAAGNTGDEPAGPAAMQMAEGGAEMPEAAGDNAAAEGATSEGNTAESNSAEGDTQERQILRLRSRNRRRRRRPPVLGLMPGHSDPVEGAGAPPAIAEIRAALAPGQRSFSAPRRQRRHAPLSGEPAAAPSGDAAAATEAGATAGTERTETMPRPRRRRRHRPEGDAARQQTGGAGVSAEPGGAPSNRPRRRGGQRQEGEQPQTRSETPDHGGRERRAEDRGPRRDRGDRRDRGERRERGGRGAPPRREVERKLYSVDAIVDRGFEDIEEEGETRRVHWTIVKRTTADQISRKPVATVYVLQRDGADTEFPTLGTARSAVNKTIVHPEKLTPSKAERAIAKK